jgi:hypothetical protein
MLALALALADMPKNHAGHVGLAPGCVLGAVVLERNSSKVASGGCNIRPGAQAWHPHLGLYASRLCDLHLLVPLPSRDVCRLSWHAVRGLCVLPAWRLVQIGWWCFVLG